MLPRQLRVGDLVDDYCPRERRLSDHAIVAMVGDEVRHVRCTACDGEHEYRKGKLPPSRKKKAGVPAPPLAPAAASQAAAAGTSATAAAADAPERPVSRAAAAADAGAAGAPTSTPEPEVPADEPTEPATPGHDGPFHRRLIRATLPRIEGAEVPQRPIPEFTMHRAATTHPRHGRPFRPGQPGGQQRPGGKGGPGGAPRHGGPRHGQGQGSADGNTFGNRGNRGGHGGQGGQGGPHGPRPARQGFQHKPSRGPKKH